MLSNLTIIFPLAVALYALFWCCRWFSLRRGEPDRLPGTAPKDPVPDRDPHFSRMDWILLGGLTAVYALVAFIGLGDTDAPQSFLHFTEGNTYALIELNDPQPITALRYYSGLNTADYLLQLSTDGETWTDQVKEDGTSGMTQIYTQLFRWNDAVLDPDYGPVRYIRIISGAEEYLGEVAVYGQDGSLLSAGEMTVASGCEALTDEQDTIPAEYTFKNGMIFDEIYHSRTALEMIEGVWPYEITHPPLGKAIISLGIRLFGMTPFGWRFMGTLFGVLMLPILYLLLKRMFGYTAAAAAGSTVFAFDFMHFVQTRLATIDTYAVFFILLMHLFMYLWLTEPPEGKRRLLWLGLAGAAFGMGAASKWVCIYAGVGLGVMWLAYWVIRFVRERKAALNAFLLNVGWCLIFFILVPCLIYYASYWSYGPSQGAGGPFRLFKREYLQMVIDNQTYMWNYHSDLVSTHPYSSKWYQWVFDVRPILYYLASTPQGETVSFAAFNNPLVSWTGLAAMGGMGWLTVRRRDERAAFILIGYLANLLPWVLVSRLTFAYHYFPCTVFLVLAISYIFADLRRLDTGWWASVGGFTAVSTGLFVLFYPVLAGIPRTAAYSRVFLKWFTDTWPF